MGRRTLGSDAGAAIVATKQHFYRTHDSDVHYTVCIRRNLMGRFYRLPSEFWRFAIHVLALRVLGGVCINNSKHLLLR